MLSMDFSLVADSMSKLDAQGLRMKRKMGFGALTFSYRPSSRRASIQMEELA